MILNSFREKQADCVNETALIIELGHNASYLDVLAKDQIFDRLFGSMNNCS